MKTEQTELMKENQPSRELYRQLFTLNLELRAFNECRHDCSNELTVIIQTIDRFMDTLIERSGMKQ